MVLEEGSKRVVRSCVMGILPRWLDFRELRQCEVRRARERRTSGTVELHSWVSALREQGTEAEPGRLGVLGLTYPSRPLRLQDVTRLYYLIYHTSYRRRLYAPKCLEELS